MSGYKARQRERIFAASCVDGDGRPAPRPTCNLCHLPVFAGDEWDISHVGAPAALGGTAVGIAHRECNRLHNNEVVTPAVAKAKRQHRKHFGITGPGRGPSPMPCGRNSKRSKSMSGEVVPRQSQAEKFRLLMIKLYGREAQT